MSTKKIILISLGILLLAVIVTSLIFMTEPTAKSEGATKQMAMLVEVVTAERGDYQPEFVATGTVSPVEDITLSPLVGGEVVRRSPEFTPGGFVKKGAVLLQIDPSDYRNVLELRKSDLEQARTNLEVEMGRQEVAEKDLALIGGDSLSAQQKSLVLRKPQLNSVRATINAAQAAVDQAQLDLARTTIRAPFDAHILSQNVTVGSQVAPGDNLGRLVGSDHYWVILNIPVSKLQYLQFTEAAREKGSEVKVRNTTAWPENTFRTGSLDKQVGALEDETRLAKVLVNVPDPLGQEAANKEKPELMIGSFVEARLLGKTIPGVIRLSRDHIRNNDRVWVMQDGELKIREVEILLNDAEFAYITDGLEDGDKVVTTNLSTVADGLPLRTTRKNASEQESSQE
ncbi:efflux RND transporter periplasmic adaptor subunit [Salinimicrobium soli]|uniref:efflux RND transporter periplasmic adaptor subunit n=1 Tax=Salinimicrobium soli TaxID=1254399 RepID=UPI003AAE752A